MKFSLENFLKDYVPSRGSVKELIDSTTTGWRERTLALYTPNPFDDNDLLVDAAGELSSCVVMEMYRVPDDIYPVYLVTINESWLKSPISFRLHLSGNPSASQRVEIEPHVPDEELGTKLRQIASQAEYLESFRAEVIHLLYCLIRYLLGSQLNGFVVKIDPPIQGRTSRTTVEFNSRECWDTLSAVLGNQRGKVTYRLVKEFLYAVSRELHRIYK